MNAWYEHELFNIKQNNHSMQAYMSHITDLYVCLQAITDTCCSKVNFLLSRISTYNALHAGYHCSSSIGLKSFIFL